MGKKQTQTDRIFNDKYSIDRLHLELEVVAWYTCDLMFSMRRRIEERMRGQTFEVSLFFRFSFFTAKIFSFSSSMKFFFHLVSAYLLPIYFWFVTQVSFFFVVMKIKLVTSIYHYICFCQPSSQKNYLTDNFLFSTCNYIFNFVFLKF